MSASFLFPLSIRGLALAVVLAPFAAGQAVSNNPIYGPTPPEVAPSSPATAYALSGIDSVDMFNGHMRLALPIHSVGGRGESGYTITISASNPPWTVETVASMNGPNDFSFTSTATAKWWHPYQTLYTPGYVVIKRAFEDLGTCPNNNVPFFRKTYTHLVFLGPDGSETPLYSMVNDGPITNGCEYPSLNRGSEFRSRDDSAMKFVSDRLAGWCSEADANGVSTEISDFNSQNLEAGMHATSNICGTLYFRNGTRYRIDRGRVRQIVDRNGNLTSLKYCGESPTQCAGKEMLVEQITDPLGRQINVNYQGCTAEAGQSCHTITYPGYEGASRTISLLWGPPTARLRGDITAASVFGDLDGTPLVQTGNCIYSVTLPNESAYSFYYNNYGELARVVLPTGGAYDYEYGPGFSNAPAEGLYASGQVLAKLNGVTNATSSPPWAPFIYRRLVKRREHLTVPAPGAILDAVAATVISYATAETATQPTHYSGNGSINGFASYTRGPVTETVTGAGGVSVQRGHTFSMGSHVYTEVGVSKIGQRADTASPGLGLSLLPGFAGPPDPLEGREILTDIGGLQTVERVYGVGGDEVGRLCQERTTTSGVTAQRLSSYDAYGNLADLYEYGFGAGPLIDQRTEGSVSYRVCPAPSTGYQRWTHSEYLSDPTYLSGIAFLPSLKTRTKVRDASGRRVSGTKFNYDCRGAQPNCSLLDSGVSTGLLLPTWPPPLPPLPPRTNYTTRGNLTRVERWISGEEELEQQEQWIGTAAASYDTAGNPLETRDGNGKVTVFTYAQCGGSLLSQIRNPLSHTTQVVWDCSLGKPTTMTDPNGKTTGYNYNEPLDRLRFLTPPSGAVTAYVYTDTPGSVKLTTIVPQNSCSDSLPRTSEVTYDGLGREAMTRVQQDAAHWIHTIRQYDALSRIYKVSKPNTTGAAEPATVTAYDALGRVTAVTSPGGAVSTWSYSGAETTFVDGAGRGRRRSQMDGLGRMLEVVENPGYTPSFATNYTYDTLDRLTDVNQSGLPRHFVYDTLGRLTSATNPENGTVTYGYDNNGNLTSREQGTGTVTMGYDDGNRLRTKSYNDGTTPAVSYTYDTDETIVEHSEPNAPLGRLTRVSTEGNTTVYRYDEMGRVTASRQSPSDVLSFVFGYGYNQAGGLEREQ